MSKPRQNLQQILDSQIQNLALTLRPGTIVLYWTVAKSFLAFLHTTYPELDKLSQLRRDPHIVGWLRSLYEHCPPYKSGTRFGYIVRLRRLLNDLALSRNSLRPGLIVQDDFPPLDQYLPKSLSHEDDRLLDTELRTRADLKSNGLLLLRATGMRIGECLNLTRDCLRPLGQRQWALQVPLGKLHNERWLPVDDDIRLILACLLSLRNQTPQSAQADQPAFLFPQPKGAKSLANAMRYALNAAARRAGCSEHITPHRLRHTYATEMLRAGVSLPALKELLGHKSIVMTMRYIHVSQNDLQQQYHQAHDKIANLYLIPKLPIAQTATETSLGIPAICTALAAATHLLAMYMRHLSDAELLRNLQRIARRLTKISKKFDELDNAPK